uniref:Uncharacterized protein n=1 Tax=Oryza meridionalis TaxID=40149 RepID=A0A0E0CXS7_9ORYZ
MVSNAFMPLATSPAFAKSPEKAATATPLPAAVPDLSLSSPLQLLNRLGLMKVDGLTDDEVKSHLHKYRLHTRRASDGGGGSGGLWMPPPEQYTTLQHSTSQSGSPQGPLQLTVSSSHAVSATAGDSCDGGEEEEEEEDDGKSESYSWEMQNGARASSSS